jgi:acyl dehydratase
MTRERMRWYVDAQATVAADDGRHHEQEPTIHDDDAYARAQGLPGIIADGMVSTNWIFGLLVETFGRDAARKGRLRTRYAAPIREGDTVAICARVTAVEPGPVETAYRLEVWCETADAKRPTAGEALIHVRTG